MSALQTTRNAQTSSPFTALKNLSSSVKVWLLLVAYLVLVKLVLNGFFPNAFSDPAQAGLFDWIPFAIFGALGLIGAWLSERTGFPQAWDTSVSNRQRLAIPILTGLVFGAALVALDAVTHFTDLILARHGVTQQYTGFIPTLLIFSGGSIIVEVIYRLFPIPVILWLVSNVIVSL